MTCSVCDRPEVAGSCKDGYTIYLSGDYPCVFNKTGAEPRNLRELPPIVYVRRPPPAEMSAEGLEDLL